MPKQIQPSDRPLASTTLVVDNGGYSIKAGIVQESVSTDSLPSCQLIPNCIARDRGRRVWIGNQYDKCSDYGEIAIKRPVEKGFLVNWEAEKAIWDASFLSEEAVVQVDPKSTNLVLTEAPNTPAALQTNCDQIVFEEYEFASYSRFIGPCLNSYHDLPLLFGDSDCGCLKVMPAECVLVIDSGFSHTTITPVYFGHAISDAVRRLEVGGKLMTNYLKELVSIRHYNMQDETHIMNEVKEAISMISQDFKQDLFQTWKGASTRQRTASSACSIADRNRPNLLVDYVLPDYNTTLKGFARPHDASTTARMRKLGGALNPGEPAEEVMTLGNERFTVPELLFSPTDIGLRQPGVPEMVLQSLSAVPTGLWPCMLANILVVGGNSLIPGFMQRLEKEIRALSPEECIVRVVRAADPIRSTWQGGARMTSNPAIFRQQQVDRQDYLENGSAWLAKRFSPGYK